MEFDNFALNGFIFNNYKSMTQFAKSLGITRSALYNKLNGTSHFNREEIMKIKKKHHLSANQIDIYFFREKLPKVYDDK